MKVTVELSDNEMAEILDLTGERKKGPHPQPDGGGPAAAPSRPNRPALPQQ
jgi:hypothetical protein